MQVGEAFSSNEDSSDAKIMMDSSGTDIGRISLENAETNYVGPAHWSAVMDEVSDTLIEP